MKLYDNPKTPNGRRARMFLAEKGITIETILVNTLKGENLGDEFLARNPFAQVPVLELDDGTCISESIAISRYFEEQQPEPVLMGRDAREKALVEMWQRRVELHVLFPVAFFFRHTTGIFADRENIIPAWGEENRLRANRGFDQLEACLASSAYIAGEAFSVADITGLCAIDFAVFVQLDPLQGRPHLARWHALVSERPSANA